MAVEFTLRCDLCGQVICTSTHSDRGLRAEAQLQRGAYCSVASGDICLDCRQAKHATPVEPGAALTGAHRIGPG
jgi:hypothetical protein